MQFSGASVRRLVVCCGLLCLLSRMLLAIDCNGNGLEDATDIASGASDDCNENQIPDECDVPPVTLSLIAKHVPVARFGRVVEAGDLDGDGDLDLVTGHQNTDLSSTISVVLNAGEGKYASAQEFAAGVQLSGLTLGDLDDDGDLDVAVTNGRAVSVLRGDGCAFGKRA